ncbi:MAG: NADH-quinone oxidoreductase subunit A [candidate division KSB1 bacterium]|nr:NADH-quinone oxidoreductase subunit A [candidate division KSB1 bacterium]
MEKIIAVLFMFAVSALLALIFFTLNRLLGPRKESVVKSVPFETGRAPITLPTHRMSIKFYMIAILFVLFDVEMIFFYPWAVVFRKLGILGLIEMGIFILVLFLGLVYAWKKGALEWE